MKQAKAYAPGNISCIFSVIEHKNPGRKGSKGVGFTVSNGVTVTVKKVESHKKKGTVKIYFNGKKIRFSTVKYVAERLNNNENLEVKISSEFPLSVGFGVSGASAIATAYALNRLLNLKKTRLELAKLAHISEVKNKTGLGDVVNQYFGGFLIKYKVSSEFSVVKLRIINKNFYYKVFKKLDTKKVISSKRKKKKINKAGLDTLNKIRISRRKSFEDIISISKEFAVNSGLLKDKRVKRLIEGIEASGGNASMIMLGNAVFSDKRFKGCKELRIVNDKARVI